MKLMNDLWLHKYNDGTYSTNILDYPNVTQSTSCDVNRHLDEVYAIFHKRKYTTEQKVVNAQSFIDNAIAAYKNEHDVAIQNELVEASIQKLLDFFKEFNFEPNFRFINTLAHAAKRNEASQYVTNYFRLIDHQYKDSIIDKIQSLEFKNICGYLKSCIKKDPINVRFKLFYGSAGTGKTTQAIKEAEGNVMICHSAMLPSDLMEDFEFVDGHPHFRPSALQIALIEGKKIVLDEINLLPFESLRFLQSILDGKKEFVYKGEVKTIADGFQIIGTMNLQINGSVFSLPEPLVDRAGELKEYKLSAKNLVAALI